VQHALPSALSGAATNSVRTAYVLLLLLQYMDTLREMAANSHATTVFLPHAPDAVGSLQAALRDGFMQGKAGADSIGAQTIQR
jgi:hypothetical protein